LLTKGRPAASGILLDKTRNTLILFMIRAAGTPQAQLPYCNGAMLKNAA
jgi:hypothetical protein